MQDKPHRSEKLREGSSACAAKDSEVLGRSFPKQIPKHSIARLPRKWITPSGTEVAAQRIDTKVRATAAASAPEEKATTLEVQHTYKISKDGATTILSGHPHWLLECTYLPVLFVFRVQTQETKDQTGTWWKAVTVTLLNSKDTNQVSYNQTCWERGIWWNNRQVVHWWVFEQE